MTTDIDALKTNEFIRRRKLRLQQVREQSKDVAKRIRQRAKVEKLKQVVELDANKQKQYLQRQEQLVKQLEEFYAKGIENIGVSHQNACEVKLQENQTQKGDASKQRGKDAVAQLRKKRQEKLDQQKKLLDRKLQARETANEVSREKSATVLDKLLTKTSSKDLDNQSKDVLDKEVIGGGDGSEVKYNDMATQWDLEPNEWEPNIPKLSLPKDDKEKENTNIESKSDKSRRLDLFALSEEMPSSLRGGLTTQEERIPMKPSLTLVSEYLQSRGLRLRETDNAETSKKKNTDELHSLKQTILRTRALKEGTGCVCQVHDEELVPVPTWQAENNCGFCLRHRHLKHTTTCSSLNMKNVSSPVKPLHPDMLPSPVLRGTSPFRRNIPLSFSAKENSTDKASKRSARNSAAPKKSSVTIYNHSTRVERDIPYNDERLVVRDLKIDDDAYSQAMKESSTDDRERDHQKKVQEVRSKVAMTKQNVEKEYRDTISFLNSLPKDMGNKPIRRAFMDEGRQQSMKECRQQKLQQEYKKIVKDCTKHNCKNKTRSKSKSPSKPDNFDRTDFQYSWMPVPDSDGNLAIHTIPTSLKEGKSCNTVKFSKVDSYHEYRSRHKHTPPTKDTNHQPKPFVDPALIQSSSDSESITSEASSTENIQLKKKDQTLKETERLSDAERIIIYKILDSKNEKAKNSRIMKDIAKSLTFIEKQNTTGRSISHSKQTKANKISSDSDRRISYGELNEGVYKAVNKNGTGDNIASMYFDKDGDKIELTKDELKYGHPCCCNKTLGKDHHHEKGTTSLQWESGDNPPQVSRPTNLCFECKCGCKNPPQSKMHKVESADQQTVRQPSAATSTSSFKTATNDKANKALQDGGYIKLIDEGGEEAGKFYIGASGFLKDAAYEVVIQLRKKGDEKELREIRPTELTKINEEDLPNRVSVSAGAAEVIAPSVTAEVLETVEVNNSKIITNEPNKSNRSNKIQDVVVNVVSEMPVNKTAKNCSSESNEDLNSRRKNTSEKAVSTSFRDSFAIPSHIPQSDYNPRPATSTYTQTSMSSPNNRPVFFHMSSSTSTAYMSPPEMIIPKFLRQDRRMSYDDLFDPRNFEMQDKIEVTDEHEYCEDYECECKKCRHARKVTLCRTNTRCKKVNHRRERAKTPPNTVRSEQDDLDVVTNSRENCQCRKCRSHKALDKPTSSNNHVNKNKRLTTPKHSFLVTRVVASSASTNKDGQKKRTKNNLNPIIRDYVNKLLALNKESLKAVQVVDQDCSSVATPGSSIINMPNNNDSLKPAIDNKISLEQIKNMLKQQILDECEKKTNNASDHKFSDVCLKDHFSNNQKFKVPRKKTIHKVKSLNISKHFLKSKRTFENKPPQPKQASLSSSKTKEHLQIPPFPKKSKSRSKSSPTPRSAPAKPEFIRSKTCTSVAPSVSKTLSNLCSKPSTSKSNINYKQHKSEEQRNTEVSSCHRATTTSTSPNSEKSATQQKGINNETPPNMSTQTSNVDSEINFIRFDEDKIQNMEKIADLTEKCTKRLSNLAKVLEEVRRNKSLAYSQISTSDSASDSDQKSDKNTNKMPANVYQSFHDTLISLESKSPDIFAPVEQFNENENHSDHFVPFLSDIPKPDSLKSPTNELHFSSYSSNKSDPSSPVNENYDHHLKSRGKPPPALSRIHLKHVQDYVIPHELSTVVEVDSPMSVKLKSQSSRNETRPDMPDSFSQIDNATYKADHKNEERNTASPDLLISEVDIPGQTKIMSTDDSKTQMIDMNQFNEIMLKPFFSLQEYAKHHNVGALDDGSNREDFIRGDIINDEISSLHSDGSLPDVISELLKRNIISEPFKFDTQSNVNSTSISSESALSVLALSKARKEKKKSSVMFKNKENIGETSDTLSISSNPDLENAFKMLGMGWASSTLKKTKERLALSSSSNTSSSSLSQFKIKSFNQDIPVLVTDTVSSVLNVSKKQQKHNAADISKNAEQQTSLTNSMTVKEFLTNELAKKITFNNKSRNDTEEFVSLFETKMPEEMKHVSRMVREDSVDNSIGSANNNRARTSTPVQLFKSMTYQSSSSSNISNGLFSNADDLSSVKQTSNSLKHSTSDKDDLTIPNFSLRIKKGSSDDCS